MLEVVLIIAAIITLQIFISIIGKVINNNGNSLFEYVYSAFDDNDAIPMTINILLNVVTPVVFMVVAYDVCKYFRLNSIADVIWVMVPGYYFYRFIVIALFLGRKEFYNCKYELIIALIGSILSYTIFIGILIKTDSFFLKADELREELGFAVILIVYHFFVKVISDKCKKKDVISDEKKYKYVKRKFNEFYKRYHREIEACGSNPDIWKLLYSIMIFENYNRGPIKRVFEYISFVFDKPKTLGIMQVSTSKYISSKTSIKLAHKKIAEILGENDTTKYSDDILRSIAYDYNQDDRYVESVLSIYLLLERCLKDNKELFSHNTLNESDNAGEIKKEIWCGDLGELSENLSDNERCILSHQIINAFEKFKESEKVQASPDGDGWQIIIKDLNNIIIDASGSCFFTEFDNASLLRFEDCNNVELTNITLQSRADSDLHDSYILEIVDSKNVTLNDVEIVGNDKQGIMIENSNVQISNSSIHNCKRCALSTEESNLRILNCKIYDCIDEVDDLVILDDETQIENLEIYSNIAENSLVRCDVESVRITSMTVHDNKYRRDYLASFEDKINSVKNEIIPWTQKRKYLDDM